MFVKKKSKIATFWTGPHFIGRVRVNSARPLWTLGCYDPTRRQDEPPWRQKTCPHNGPPTQHSASKSTIKTSVARVDELLHLCVSFLFAFIYFFVLSKITLHSESLRCRSQWNVGFALFSVYIDLKNIPWTESEDDSRICPNEEKAVKYLLEMPPHLTKQ